MRRERGGEHEMRREENKEEYEMRGER